MFDKTYQGESSRRAGPISQAACGGGGQLRQPTRASWSHPASSRVRAPLSRYRRQIPTRKCHAIN
jgi:hypothetical protein